MPFTVKAQLTGKWHKKSARCLLPLLKGGHVSIKKSSHKTGISIEQYDFSEPQHGKDVLCCDRIMCPMKLAVRCFCDEGYDIQAARDMREALLERPVKVVTATVCEVNEKQRTIDVFKIIHFSAYHNFEFGS